MCEQTQQAQQISFSGGTPCLGRRQRCFATVRAQIQSQDLHTTSAFRRSGSQGLLQDRLPRPSGSAARLRCAPLAPWTEGGASLYDLSEGQPQTLEGDSSTQAVQHHRSPIPGTSSAAQAGRAGLDWLGMRSPESLLCAAPSRPRKTMENRGLQPLRQARSGLRLRQPLMVAALVGRGPRPDVDRFVPLLDTALSQVRIDSALADAGYDSEPNHRHARERRRVLSFIPATHGRPTTKLPTGKYRRRMRQRLNKDYGSYGQRAQAETGFSMVKRRLANMVNGRGYWSQCRDMSLLAISHNVLLLYAAAGFLQSLSGTFSRVRCLGADAVQ